MAEPPTKRSKLVWSEVVNGLEKEKQSRILEVLDVFNIDQFSKKTDAEKTIILNTILTDVTDDERDGVIGKALLMLPTDPPTEMEAVVVPHLDWTLYLYYFSGRFSCCNKLYSAYTSNTELPLQMSAESAVITEGKLGEYVRVSDNSKDKFALYVFKYYDKVPGPNNTRVNNPQVMAASKATMECFGKPIPILKANLVVEGEPVLPKNTLRLLTHDESVVMILLPDGVKKDDLGQVCLREINSGNHFMLSYSFEDELSRTRKFADVVRKLLPQMLVEDQHRQDSYCEFLAKVDLSIRKPPLDNTTVTDTSWGSETLSVSSIEEEEEDDTHTMTEEYKKNKDFLNTAQTLAGMLVTAVNDAVERMTVSCRPIRKIRAVGAIANPENARFLQITIDLWKNSTIVHLSEKTDPSTAFNYALQKLKPYTNNICH